jgi:hypothetical protein
MATAILADVNLTGQIDWLVAEIESGEWAELWAGLGVVLLRFGDLGLSETATDRELWRTCQAHQVVLITANRNRDDPDSLEAVIRDENTPASLPVLTIGKGNRVLVDRGYADRVALKLLEHLLDLDALRGTGRLYLP